MPRRKTLENIGILQQNLPYMDWEDRSIYNSRYDKNLEALADRYAATAKANPNIPRDAYHKAHATNMGRAQYAASQRPNSITGKVGRTAAYFVPKLGTAMFAADIINAAQEGNYKDAAMNTLMTLAIGPVLNKGMRLSGKGLKRLDDHIYNKPTNSTTYNALYDKPIRIDGIDVPDRDLLRKAVNDFADYDNKILQNEILTHSRNLALKEYGDYLHSPEYKTILENAKLSEHTPFELMKHALDTRVKYEQPSNSDAIAESVPAKNGNSKLIRLGKKSDYETLLHEYTHSSTSNVKPFDILTDDQNRIQQKLIEYTEKHKPTPKEELKDYTKDWQDYITDAQEIRARLMPIRIMAHSKNLSIPDFIKQYSTKSLNELRTAFKDEDILHMLKTFPVIVSPLLMKENN